MTTGQGLEIQAGRSDAGAALESVVLRARQPPRLGVAGVFACGPGSMVAAARGASTSQAEGGATVHFHAESFEF